MKTEKTEPVNEILVNNPEQESVTPATDIKILTSTEDNKSAEVKVLKDKATFLYKTRRPFVLIKSGSTYELQSDYYNTKAYEKGFSINDLNFIKSVKEYVEKNNIALKFIEQDFQSQTINYIQVKKYEAGEFLQDLVCIDINGAYWQTAYQLGIISENIYFKGLKVSKVVRLAALGSLARKKQKHIFDGEKMQQVIVMNSFATENLWFAICKRISDVMSETVKKLGDNFVFYWVDGIYVKHNKKAINIVFDIFDKNGYTCKIESIPEIRFTDKGFEVQKALKGDVKKFSWSQKKNNQPITTYLKNRELVKHANEIIYPKKKKGKKSNEKKTNT